MTTEAIPEDFDQPSLELLTQMASELDDRDFTGFAELVAARWPALGATVQCHAEAADGNSPDVSEWPSSTIADFGRLQNAKITDEDEARKWWNQWYEDP